MQLRHQGIALGYSDTGTTPHPTAPPLVLVHGWGLDRSVMQPLAGLARATHRVVAVDLRGHGESDAPASAYTVPSLAADVAYVIDALALPPPVVIGHSAGGAVAFEVAAQLGARVAGAVILEAMVAAPAQVLAGLRSVIDGLRSTDYRARIVGLFTYLTGARFDPAERARLIELAGRCPQHVLVSLMEELVAYDSVAAAAHVTCPLLYVGTSTIYADLARLRALCPQLVTHELAGCGHYFPLEVPDQVMAVIGAFLER